MKCRKEIEEEKVDVERLSVFLDRVDPWLEGASDAIRVKLPFFLGSDYQRFWIENRLCKDSSSCWEVVTVMGDGRWCRQLRGTGGGHHHCGLHPS